MEKIVVVLFFIISSMVAYTKPNDTFNINKISDLAGTVGIFQGSVTASYVYNWKFDFGKRKIRKLAMTYV